MLISLALSLLLYLLTYHVSSTTRNFYNCDLVCKYLFLPRWFQSMRSTGGQSRAVLLTFDFEDLADTHLPCFKKYLKKSEVVNGQSAFFLFFNGLSELRNHFK